MKPEAFARTLDPDLLERHHDQLTDPAMRMAIQAITNVRRANEAADRANLANYEIQLRNGYMNEDLYADLTARIYERRPEWNTPIDGVC